MKHLKEYKLWEQSRELASEQEEFLNQYVKGTWRINSEGLVDVEWDFDCSGSGIKSLMGIRFGSVGGNFYCHNNQLTSLVGAPQEVGGNFDCSENQLTSLEGAPQEVGGGFYCSENQLTSLEGAPREVSGDFYCYRNQLTSLEGAPREVRGNFYCYRNQLTSLVGAPQEVGGNFDCYRNQLTSLVGAPQEVGGNFDCNMNPISEQTMELICREMREYPEMEYGAILAYLQKKIPREDWEKLDKSSLDKMNQTQKKVYGMLGGIGGI